MQSISTDKAILFNSFQTSIGEIELPARFTFPFYYEPHPLSVIAAGELQQFMQKQEAWSDKFGLNAEDKPLKTGKMFGVLVVQNEVGELGYLAAFSGKLDGPTNHFVPFVYNLPETDNFYTKGMRVIESLGVQINEAGNSPEMAKTKSDLENLKASAEKEIENYRVEMRNAKADRKKQRKALENSNSESNAEFLMEKLANESRHQRYLLKALEAEWQSKIQGAQKNYDVFKNELNRLIEERALSSADLQKQLFDKYRFLNRAGESKRLTEIIQADGLPPSGAGDCAAPKLLQYAFANTLKPIALAEFWWGASPKTTIRHHKKYYPACNSKCKPILNFMLKGMPLDLNPMWIEHGQNKELITVYEDDYILLVNKPFGLLSVPGKEINESVASRMIEKYGENPPMLVHRLDMDTSGLLLLAKSTKVHKNLQAQFLKRTVKKRYVALLEGECSLAEGVIDLPLRVDLEDRPNQMVCYAHGKRAVTQFEVTEIKNGKTRINFFPQTGRTHQLRVHAAHPLGLNCPIVGDILYGTDNDRMHLHAEYLEFKHPETRKMVSFEVKAEF
ncbi:RNA pseudouridine synthase [Cryomorpha ignava]|uniref:RNA pseudouridine synthase n=1 Tax=Cryomorpha ignava TaxID=101383 RepID=A0A7K3WSW0_9FLAO|nr:RluA family pseudouridine synthase [Cryomorpha ignava]NEN23745.1 RNA pseudouridine synthase [Cryomorpha ignava]